MELGRREFLRYGAAAGLVAVSPQAFRSCYPNTKPNILVVMADDMRYDHLAYMPQTRALFAAGTEFTACRDNVSLCQPARIAFLKGRWARHHGVYDNHTYMGQANESLGPWMHSAGYRTAVIGKYPFPVGGSPLPGWDVRRTFIHTTEQEAHGYGVFDGTSVSYPPAYQADYVTAEVQSFIATASQPWFCWATPTNPHVSFSFDLEPRPEDLDEWLGVEWPIVPDDNSTKPSWMQAIPPMSQEAVAGIQTAAIGQLQELNAVDDGMAAIFDTLVATGQLGFTIVVFTSDNGVLYGEHRIWSLVPALKNLPYEPSMHVPLLARGPGFASGTSASPVCTQDITAMCLELAGLASAKPHDGMDLRTAPFDRALLHERTTTINPVAGMPAGVGVTTATRKLWRHDASDPDRFEMYLLDTDPDELVNVAYDPAFAAERYDLEVRLALLLDEPPPEPEPTTTESTTTTEPTTTTTEPTTTTESTTTTEPTTTTESTTTTEPGGG